MRRSILVFGAILGFGKSLLLLLSNDIMSLIPWTSPGMQLAMSAMAIVFGLSVIYAGTVSRIPRLVRGFGLYAACAGIAYGVMPAEMWGAIISMSIDLSSAHPVIFAALSAVLSAAMLWSAVDPSPPKQGDSGTPLAVGA